MARYKYIDTNPQFLAVDLARQLLPGWRSVIKCRKNARNSASVRVSRESGDR